MLRCTQCFIQLKIIDCLVSVFAPETYQIQFHATDGGWRVNGNPLENNVSQANHINHNSHGQLGTAPSTPNLHHASSTSQLLHNSACSSNTRELQCNLKEIRYMTNRLKLKDEEVVSDWKFAAMVIDRFCLITFTTFTIITTVAVLLSAPHIVVE